MFKDKRNKQSEQAAIDQVVTNPDILYQGIPLLYYQNQKMPSGYEFLQHQREREATAEAFSVHTVHSALDMLGQQLDGQGVWPATLIDEDVQVMVYGTPDFIDETERREQSQSSHLWHIIPNWAMETVRHFMFRGVKPIES